MTRKLVISEDQIQQFTIDAVKNFEGCPEALKYLKRIYGDASDNLRKRKKDFLLLIENKKGDWSSNFLLNLLPREDRLEFYQLQTEKVYYKVSETVQVLMNEFSIAATHYMDDNRKTKELKKLLKVANELTQDDEVGDKSKANQLVVKALLEFYSKLDGHLTRSNIRSFKYLAEAMYLLEGADYHEVMEQYHLDLIEYTELFY